MVHLLIIPCHYEGLPSHYNYYRRYWIASSFIYLCVYIYKTEQMIFTLDEEIMGTITPPEGGFWEMGNFTGSKLWEDHKMSPFNQPVKNYFTHKYVPKCWSILIRGIIVCFEHS